MSCRLSIAALAALAVLAPAHAQSADPVRDHAAILKIAGEFAVDFAFDETVLLQPGTSGPRPCAAAPTRRWSWSRTRPRAVVLQHLLVDGKSGHVTKHWREDWVYQAPRRFEFSADQTWTVRALSPQETTGAWTQCVYEVSDAPRYCGTGRWTYSGEVATWTSDESWRPLPRREYTRRSDYNALRVVNRHTVTPNGWSHEQFNTKVLRKRDGRPVEIAREFGFDDYRRDSQVDFAPAYAYWKATSDFWAGVRARWAGFLNAPPGLHLKTKLDGMAMVMPLFEQADTLVHGGKVKAADTDAVFARYVEAAPAPADR